MSFADVPTYLQPYTQAARRFGVGFGLTASETDYFCELVAYNQATDSRERTSISTASDRVPVASIPALVRVAASARTSAITTLAPLRNRVSAIAAPI